MCIRDRSTWDGKEARIIVKCNSLLDKQIIQKLYEASVSGVKIDLIIRGICALKPGMDGVSENIRVISIVGRYLEHSRIFYFYNNADPKIFLSSADWMPRNLDRRIEILIPVESPQVKEEIMDILENNLKDTVKARTEDDSGNYSKVDKRGKRTYNSQEEFEKTASDNYHEYQREGRLDLMKEVISSINQEDYDDDEGYEDFDAN
eukprot:TRINITY_DN21943_c0_g1_i1.p1 TRINITY_DN21943_c0_g1~~TRINITY_DN21943_c0_g1_i1.p1  ORF type:complete len:205 (+),score=10.50 TRINITY_DN21943_c0_g1_i1:138-752(+)